MSRRWSVALSLLCVWVLWGEGVPVSRAADNVVYVTWDGFRWQEMFAGAEEALLTKEAGGVPEAAPLRAEFWRDTPEARREALLPFVWSVVAKQGQLFGDPTRRATARVTNGKKFSYPGYSEMFAGMPDDRIDSNAKVPNPNLTVLEYLHRRPSFAGRVAAFATWDVIEYVLNRQRSGLLVQTGWSLIDDPPLSPGQERVNQLVRELPRLWRGNTYDLVTVEAAREHLLKHKPRVLYVGLGETDEWAHARRYDLYLEAARRSDDYVRRLWELMQSLPEYRDRTAFVLSTDHGRGGTPADWIHHKAEIQGAENIWIAAWGAGVPPLGVRSDVQVTQSQIAATLAELVGEDFRQGGSSQAAAPLPLRP